MGIGSSAQIHTIVTCRIYPVPNMEAMVRRKEIYVVAISFL